ncbi:MAG: NUDIX domain-containing protein [bacterium]|nr:NUDIX domain-containing protein [bacterium]
MIEEQRTRTAVGVMILKDGKILLAKRKTSHGAGEYAFPGGHLEYMEMFEDCARRETKEECGIAIQNIRFQFVANLKLYAPKHYTHIGMIADWESGEPEILEPEKAEEWGWYELDKLPQPMFKSCELALESYRNGTIYYPEVK